MVNVNHNSYNQVSYPLVNLYPVLCVPQQQSLQTQPVTQPIVPSSMVFPQIIPMAPTPYIPTGCIVNYPLHGFNTHGTNTLNQNQNQFQFPESQWNQQSKFSQNNANNCNNNTCIQPTVFNNDDEKKIDTQSDTGKPSQFNPKFNNHAKGNFYISKEMIAKLINDSDEEFITNDDGVPDEKLAFGHYKESVAMQINDGQVKVIETKQGLMIIINIDLHYKKSNDIMYLIAMENDQEFRHKVRWCIVNFMTEKEIKSNYGLDRNQLPKSSRKMAWYQNAIKRVPKGFCHGEISKLIHNTRFKSLPSKTSKRRTGNEKMNDNNTKSRISAYNLKYWVKQSLYNDNLPIHPVVVIKGKNQWIEWKRYVQLFDDNEYEQYVGISMRYHQSNKQWGIECMDYDAGRVFYQHRLASLPKHDEYSYCYNELSKYITTQLEIYNNPSYHSHRSHSAAWKNKH